MASGCYTVLSELILTALSTIPVLAKIPARRQTLFAHDLALIAASVRSVPRNRLPFVDDRPNRQWIPDAHTFLTRSRSMLKL